MSSKKTAENKFMSEDCGMLGLQQVECTQMKVINPSFKKEY